VSFRRKDDFAGAAFADDPTQPLDTAPPRKDTEIEFRLTEL
jgi:hypothetical protein